MTQQKDTIPDSERHPNVRRRFPRYAIDTRITVVTLRSGKSVSMWGRTNEMGKDGVGATLTGELLPGEVVSLHLALPMSASTIKIRALVRYRDGLRHGFEFLAMNPENREMVDQACAMLADNS